MMHFISSTLCTWMRGFNHCFPPTYKTMVQFLYSKICSAPPKFHPIQPCHAYLRKVFLTKHIVTRVHGHPVANRNILGNRFVAPRSLWVVLLGAMGMVCLAVRPNFSRLWSVSSSPWNLAGLGLLCSGNPLGQGLQKTHSNIFWFAKAASSGRKCPTERPGTYKHFIYEQWRGIMQIHNIGICKYVFIDSYE